MFLSLRGQALSISLKDPSIHGNTVKKQSKKERMSFGSDSSDKAPAQAVLKAGAHVTILNELLP
jgi:hypothetical protein